QSQRRGIRPHAPEPRSRDRADEDYLAAPLASRHATKPAKLPQSRPVVAVRANALRVRPAANGEEDDRSAAARYRFGNRKGQRAGAANDGDGIVARRPGRRQAHSSISSWARRAAIVSGREPDLINSTSRAISGSTPDWRATGPNLSRKLPLPKNIAS